jgi:hypothetical protein
MRKLTLLLFVILTYTRPSFSSTISGTVTDAKTGNPLEYVSVFLAGTTNGTVTKQDGSFSLTVSSGGSVELVATHLGYQTATYLLSGLGLNKPLAIPLQEKDLQLSTVNVYGVDPNRKQNMNEFLFGFFGDSEIGKKCKILNPQVLKLSKKEIPGKIGQYYLTAYADSALIIENKALGYTIRYTLESFRQTKFETTFLGYLLFIDNLLTAKKKDKILESRERVYQGSQMHFFRSLFAKTLEQNGFKIFSMNKMRYLFPGQSSHGLMSDTVFVPEPSTYLLQTQIPLNVYEKAFIMENCGALQWSNPFEIRFTLNGEDMAYQKNGFYHTGLKRSLGQQTTVIKLTSVPFLFYPNGSCKNPGDLVTIGYWSFKKVGEILPWDYQPPKTAKQVVTLH